MTKIRAKNLKPKIKGDFKKLRAKVGKKVVRSNQTKISVKTKQIQVPLQAKLTSLVDIEDQKKALNDILRQINHYNDSSRVDAIEMLKRFLSTCSNSESYIVMVMSKVIELLFDNDKETRKSLLDLLSNIFAKFTTVVFSPVSIILSTYICSGLTSLSKGIRKDTISLLSQISDRHCSLLEASLEKIVQHLLSLLSDSFLVASAVSLYATSSTTNTTSKADNLSHRSSSSSILCPTTSNNSTGKSTSTPATTSTSLVSILKVLETLLCKLLLLPKGTTSLVHTTNPNTMMHHHSRNILLRKVRSSPKSVLDLPQKYRSLFTTYASSHSSVLSSTTSTSSTTSHTIATSITSLGNGINSPQAALSDNCILILFSRLLTLWNSLLSDNSSSHVTPTQLPILHTLVSIALYTLKAFPTGITHTHSNDLHTSIIRFTKCVLLSFPHSLDDSSIVSLRRDMVKRVTLELELLDFTICDLLLTVHTLTRTSQAITSNYSHSNHHDNITITTQSIDSLMYSMVVVLEIEFRSVQDFLLMSLIRRVDTMMMSIQQQPQQPGEVVVEDEETETITAGTKLLFRLLYQLLVASQFVTETTTTTTNLESHQHQHQHGINLQRKVIEQLDRILTTATPPSASSTGNYMLIRPSILLRHSIICLCNIISHNNNSNSFEDDSDSNSARSMELTHPTILTNNISTKLIESLVKIPLLLKLWFKESPIILETVAKALLVVVNRVVALSDTETCILLEKAVLSIFETTSSSSTTKLKTKLSNLYSASPLTMRFLWLDIWAQTTFQDISSATTQLLNGVMTAASHSSTANDNRILEYKYALRLVYQRRKEMISPSSFIDILANALISYLKYQLSHSNIKLEEMSSTQIQSLLLLQGEVAVGLREEEVKYVHQMFGRYRWLATEIGDVARWSCSVASTGIYSVTLQLLQTITNAFKNSYYYSTDVSTTTSSKSSSSSIYISVDWTKKYAIMVAVAESLTVLLQPHHLTIVNDHDKVVPLEQQPVLELPIPAQELDEFLMSYSMQSFIDIFPSSVSSSSFSSSSSSVMELLEEYIHQNPQYLDPLYILINNIFNYRSNIVTKYNIKSWRMNLWKEDSMTKEVFWVVEGLFKPWQLLEPVMKTKVLKIIELVISRNANCISTAIDDLVITTSSSTVFHIVIAFLSFISKNATLECNEDIRAEANRIYLNTMDCMNY